MSWSGRESRRIPRFIVGALSIRASRGRSCKDSEGMTHKSSNVWPNKMTKRVVGRSSHDAVSAAETIHIMFLARKKKHFAAGKEKKFVASSFNFGHSLRNEGEKRRSTRPHSCSRSCCPRPSPGCRRRHRRLPSCPPRLRRPSACSGSSRPACAARLSCPGPAGSGCPGRARSAPCPRRCRRGRRCWRGRRRGLRRMEMSAWFRLWGVVKRGCPGGCS